MNQKWIREYFTFTKKERNAVVILLFLVVLIAILPYLVPVHTAIVDPVALAEFERGVALLKPVTKDSTGDRHYSPGTEPTVPAYSGSHSPPAKLFYFDPNTLAEEGWVKLGVSEKTARTIRHYCEKGGKFRKPEDIGKIWGLKPEDISRLMPYVKLPAASFPPGNTARTVYTSENRYAPKATARDLMIDLNRTDTFTLQLLPGIGSRLAARIVSFREKLGGFYSVSQVAETYGLPDSTFEKIRPHLKVTSQNIVLLNINTLPADRLQQHPYIRWKLANAIVQYRQQHGPFTQKEDLLQIVLLTPELYQKLQSYLILE